jgi:NAD(P)-dependent dehydrogenase (short-subunit alcohol dehydrogenase family)
MSPNAFRSVVDIYLLGSYHVLRAAHPLLRAPGAVVINARPHRHPLTIEWGDDGIRVNSVVPVPIEGTEGMARLAPTEQARETVRATVPAARWGTREVAELSSGGKELAQCTQACPSHLPRG